MRHTLILSVCSLLLFVGSARAQDLSLTSYELWVGGGTQSASNGVWAPQAAKGTQSAPLVVAAVPEPGSVALLAGGSVLLLMRLKRRRSAGRNA
jgi:hypothetical protein